MGTATLQENLTQRLVGISHDPLFQLFLDVWKSYNSLDRGWCMDILRGYEMGQNTARIIAHHWYSLLFVPKASRFLGMVLGPVGGVTQGYPAPPMIFNIVLDVVVRAVLELVCGTQEARHRMGWEAGEQNLVFCVDDKRI